MLSACIAAWAVGNHPSKMRRRLAANFVEVRETPQRGAFEGEIQRV